MAIADMATREQARATWAGLERKRTEQEREGQECQLAPALVPESLCERSQDMEVETGLAAQV